MDLQAILRWIFHGFIFKGKSIPECGNSVLLDDERTSLKALPEPLSQFSFYFVHAELISGREGLPMYTSQQECDLPLPRCVIQCIWSVKNCVWTGIASLTFLSYSKLHFTVLVWHYLQERSPLETGLCVQTICDGYTWYGTTSTLVYGLLHVASERIKSANFQRDKERESARFLKRSEILRCLL
jgi:hypothetical protein